MASLDQPQEHVKRALKRWQPKLIPLEESGLHRNAVHDSHSVRETGCALQIDSRGLRCRRVNFLKQADPGVRLRAIVVSLDDLADPRVHRQRAQSIRSQAAMVLSEPEADAEPGPGSLNQTCFERWREALKEDVGNPSRQADPRAGQSDFTDIVQ